jgi:hypothetical protein
LSRNLNYKTKSILFVKTCGDESINYNGFLSGDIDWFVSQNPKVKFMLLNGPSLRLAKSWPHKSQLMKIVGLDNAKKYSIPSVHIAKGAIEAVSFFNLEERDVKAVFY